MMEQKQSFKPSELMHKFSSKSDLVKYLTEQCKYLTPCG